MGACDYGSIAPTPPQQAKAQTVAAQPHATPAPASPFRDESPSVQSLQAALGGELFGVPVGPVEAVSCRQQSHSIFSCDVQFGANDGPTYPEPFSARLVLTRSGEAWVISE